jgi:hypothetical protein
MRVAVVLAAALLLSGCAWLQKQAPWATPPAPASAQAPAKPEPAPAHPAKPRPRAERPTTTAAPAPQQIQSQPQSPPPVDYSARCHEMAGNRADDAKQLGASSADQTKVENDTYRDCMQQSVK